jgi:hypothetical protein
MVRGEFLRILEKKGLLSKTGPRLVEKARTGEKDNLCLPLDGDIVAVLPILSSGREKKHVAYFDFDGNMTYFNQSARMSQGITNDGLIISSGDASCTLHVFHTPFDHTFPYGEGTRRFFETDPSDAAEVSSDRISELFGSVERLVDMVSLFSLLQNSGFEVVVLTKGTMDYCARAWNAALSRLCAVTSTTPRANPSGEPPLFVDRFVFARQRSRTTLYGIPTPSTSFRAQMPEYALFSCTKCEFMQGDRADREKLVFSDDSLISFRGEERLLEPKLILNTCRDSVKGLVLADMLRMAEFALGHRT